MIGSEEIAFHVVVAGEVRAQNLEAVADGDPGRDDEERVAEALVLGIGELVESLPGDKHRHDHGLAAARGHLEGDAVEAGVSNLAVLAELVLDPGLAVAGNLTEEDRGLEGLDLAEEERLLAAGLGPVGQQVAGDRRDAGVSGAPPGADMLAHAVDEVVVERLLRGEVAGQRELRAAPRLGLGDRAEVGAAATAVGDLVGDAIVVEPEMARRLAERRVQDRVVDHDRWQAVPLSAVAGQRCHPGYASGGPGLVSLAPSPTAPEARSAIKCVRRAGVTQLAEYLLPKQNVAGSNPVSRSKLPPIRHAPFASVGLAYRPSRTRYSAHPPCCFARYQSNPSD